MSKAARLMTLAGLALLCPLAARAQTAPPNADQVRARYTKYEYRIPMRDGVRLFTAVYVPKDASRRYPFLLTRTPYSVAPYGVDNYRAALGPSESFEREGFIFVYRARAQLFGHDLGRGRRARRGGAPQPALEKSVTAGALSGIIRRKHRQVINTPSLFRDESRSG